MRKYIVEKPDGDWDIYTATPWRELTRRVPKVKKGVIELDGKTYVLDPHRFRRMSYRPLRFLKLVTEYCYVQIWKEGDRTPVELFAAELYGMEGPADDRTAEKFAMLSRSERLARLVHTGMDWTTILLILMGVAVVALAAALVASNSHAVPPVGG